EDAREHGDPEAMIKIFAETTITRLITEGGRIAGAFGYLRDTGAFVLFEAPAVILATGGIGKTFKYSSNSWEYTGDGHALALLAGATLMNMEFVQFHPTHMVWPLSVRGLLVTAPGDRGGGRRARDRGIAQSRAFRRGRGLRRHARHQPAGRELPLGPAGVRPPGRHGRDEVPGFTERQGRGRGCRAGGSAGGGT